MRLLSTDRLSNARTPEGLERWGSTFSQGLPKSQFSQLLDANSRGGHLSGVAVLLRERPDLRVRVEATLSQLLGRSMSLEMTDGNLKPTMRLKTGTSYDLFSSEAHGVLELIVLLANLYDDQIDFLLIDEPELNLHPQYQSFLLSEIRRIRDKRVVVATHSPFLLDVRTIADLENVIVFHPDFRVPSSYRSNPEVDREVLALLPRMTEQHRTFFFASRPVFVEGYHDATVIGSIQRALGLSAEAAGSSLIPASGKDDVSRFLMLCTALGKDATFIFDLDALFDQRLTRGAGQNQALADRVASAGQGSYEQLRGQLEQDLTSLVALLLQVEETTLPTVLVPLKTYLMTRTEAKRRRVALLVALAEFKDALEQLGDTQLVSRILGRFRNVLEHLAALHVHVLPNGALENNLPSYTGNPYAVPDDAKGPASDAEVTWLAGAPSEAEIAQRYGALGEIVRSLPAQKPVDVLPVLQIDLANVLHTVIMGIREGQLDSADRVENLLGPDRWTTVSGLYRFEALQVESRSVFSGRVVVLDRFGLGELTCNFTQDTQTNNPGSLVLSPGNQSLRE